MFPHLLSSSIVRKDVATMTEEVRNGKVIPVISIRKGSELVMKTMTPDGKITNLLSQINEKRKEEKKAKKARKRAASRKKTVS